MLGGLERGLVRPGKVVRQRPACRRTIGAGGQLRQHPKKACLRIDANRATHLNRRVKDGEDPAGLRGSDEHVVFQQPASCESEAVLDPVVADLDMAIAELGVQRELLPVIAGDRGICGKPSSRSRKFYSSRVRARFVGMPSHQ